MSIQLGRSDCGGEISEKQSLWGIEISPIVPGSSCFNRLNTVENSKTVMLKTDCVRSRKVPTKRLWRGNFSVLDKWSLMGAGRLRNVVTHTGWTVLIVFVDQFKWNLSLVR